jgi:hypothetical protein
MKDTQTANESQGARARAGRDSVKDLVMNEAAAAIMTAGRELGELDRLSVRDFLRGPALKVGLALSVMGVTMWISELNEEHRLRKARRGAAADRQPRQRRARGTTSNGG